MPRNATLRGMFIIIILLLLLLLLLLIFFVIPVSLVGVLERPRFVYER
jgi:hypothetical protein